MPYIRERIEGASFYWTHYENADDHTDWDLRDLTSDSELVAFVQYRDGAGKDGKSKGWYVFVMGLSAEHDAGPFEDVNEAKAVCLALYRMEDASGG